MVNTRWRELAPISKGSQDAESRNLGLTYQPSTLDW